jgi:type IV secretion system protein VirB4
MLLRSEFRNKAKSFSDLLPYAALIENGIVMTKSATFVAGWWYQGPDTESATPEELEVLSARVNNALKAYGTGFMLHTDLIRVRAGAYSEENQSQFPDRTTRLIDQARRSTFSANGNTFENHYAMILSYRAPNLKGAKAGEAMFSGGKNVKTDYHAKSLQVFKDAIDRIESEIGSVVKMERMTDLVESDKVAYSELLEHINYCIGGVKHPVRIPIAPMYLDSVLSREFYAGVSPKIGDKYIKVIGLRGTPAQSYPTMMDQLNNLSVELRFNTRFIALDQYEAKSLISRYRKRWKQKATGLKQAMFGMPNTNVDLDALTNVEDAQAAEAESESGVVKFGFYTATVILYDDDLEKVEEAAKEVRTTLNNMGFISEIETINSVEAYLGSLPGEGERNVRRPLLHTLNLADMLPLSAIWAGSEVNPCPFYANQPYYKEKNINVPPLMYAAAAGATPFRFNLHVGDLGHSMILGPTGAGKSTLLSMIMAQHFRYAGARVFAFDKGYSAFILNQAAGGTHYDLASDNSKISFAPLSRLDTDSDKAWANEWVESLIALQGIQVQIQHRKEIYEAIEHLSFADQGMRSISHFANLVQDLEIRSALKYYTSGPGGSLLDADQDSFSEDERTIFTVFEVEHLMAMGEKIVVPTLMYLFRRIEKALDGKPTLIVLDEAWLMLDHPVFRAKIKEWLKVLRKANCAVVFATQSLSDILKSQIKDALIESCPTKVYLPNPKAMDPAIRPVYEDLGFNRRQISLLAMATPKRHYYIVSDVGRRLVDLALTKTELAFVGASGKEDIALARQMIEQFGETWVYEWLYDRGLDKAAQDWLA